jgi:hypothetical protein
MKNELKLLKEWALNYIKNGDILVRQIEKIEENKDGWDIVVTTKSGMKFYLIVPKIEGFEGLLKKIGDKRITVVVFNTKPNLEVIMENWSKIKDYPNLCIMFVNPNSELDKKWLVFPHTHERVTEKASLKKGLKALFQTVEQWKG